MAQILKESVKKSIVDSAIKDIFDHGLSKSSMRRIAENAQMTVGNLYRYFKNKDEIVNYIVNPVVERINVVIERNLNQRINFTKNTFDWSAVTTAQTLQTFDELAMELVNLYEELPRPLMIMMMHNTINDAIKEWFTQLMIGFMENKNYICDENRLRCNLLARSYASSLFAGVKECLTKNDLKKEELILVVKAYFRGYFMMIDQNFVEWEA